MGLFGATMYFGNNKFVNLWKKLTQWQRYAGLTLLAAYSFTLLTAAPVGVWQPDSRQMLQSRWQDLQRENNKLALLDAVNADLKGNLSVLNIALLNFASNIALIDFRVPQIPVEHPPKKQAIAREIASAIVDQTMAPSRDDFLDNILSKPIQLPAQNQASPEIDQMDRKQARLAASAVDGEINKVDKKIELARSTMADLVSGAFGSIGEVFVGPLLGAFVEAAANRIADTYLTKTAVADNLSRWMLGQGGQGEPPNLHIDNAAIAEDIQKLSTFLAQPATVEETVNHAVEQAYQREQEMEQKDSDKVDPIERFRPRVP